MNAKVLPVGVALLLLSGFAYSASIYKCTKKDKTVVFTDGKCPADASIAVIHKETEQDVQRRTRENKIANIKRLVANNQADAAKDFALKNDLLNVYQEQLAASLQQKSEAEKQAAEREKQQQITIQQQTLAVQQQQLELQKQQLAADKALAEQKQQQNTQPYYTYPLLSYPQSQHCHTQNGIKHCVPASPSRNTRIAPLSSGGMNPPPSTFPTKMNPP